MNDLIQTYDIVFPVFGGELDKDGYFVPKSLYGTAFYIKNNFFVTCCHTIDNVRQHPIVALGFQNENNIVSYKSVVDSETFESNDSGILVCEIERAQSYKWLNQKLVMLNEVISTGFPFGFDSVNRQLYTRSFKGEISMIGNYHTFASKPPCYELSYMCPKGLSGAPLICLTDGQLVVCGMTIGNEITDVIVSSFREELQTPNKISVYEKSEAFHRGIAMQTESFFGLNSKLLGGTFLEYLTKEKLIL